MTREELYTKAPGLMIPQPFAAGDASHLPSFTPILNEINGSDVNFIEGFTAAFSAPSSAGGRYVTREEMNAIGHLASANWFKLMCGGIFTFDADLATKIGGYPRGAILDYLDGLNYYRVVSLVDNNMVNFLGAEPTGTQQTISGSVDGVNWAYCERGIVEDAADSFDLIKELSISGSFDSPGAEATSIGSFTAKKTGTITFDGIMGCTKAEGVSQGGFVLAIHENIDGLDPLEVQFDVFYGRGNMMIGGPDMPGPKYWSTHQKVCTVERGKQYTMFIIGRSCTFTGNGFKIGIL